MGWEETPFAPFVKQLDNYTPDTSLLILLDMFKDRQCQLPHDRVYSLLSICAPNERAAWKVDYTLSVVDLTQQVMQRSWRIKVCICTLAVLSKALSTFNTLPWRTGHTGRMEPAAWIKFQVEADEPLPTNQVQRFNSMWERTGDKRRLQEGFLEVELDSFCSHH